MIHTSLQPVWVVSLCISEDLTLMKTALSLVSGEAVTVLQFVTCEFTNL